MVSASDKAPVSISDAAAVGVCRKFDIWERDLSFLSQLGIMVAAILTAACALEIRSRDIGSLVSHSILVGGGQRGTFPRSGRSTVGFLHVSENSGGPVTD